MKTFFKIMWLIIQEMVDNWQYKNAYYYYNPRMERGMGENTLYAIDVYKYGRTKRKPDCTYVDRNPKKLMKMVRKYVDYMNSKRDISIE